MSFLIAYSSAIGQTCVMILETLPALSSFTVEQKLRLVWELWQDVSRDPTITSGTAEQLNRRLSDYSAAPDDTRTTDEVTAGILALKQRLVAARK